MKGKNRALKYLDHQKVDRPPIYGDIEDKINLNAYSLSTSREPRKKYAECCHKLGIDMTRGYSASFGLSRYDKSDIKYIKDPDTLLDYIGIYNIKKYLLLIRTVEEDIRSAGYDFLILPQIKWSFFGNMVDSFGYENFSTSIYNEDPLTLKLVEILAILAVEDVFTISVLKKVKNILYMDDIAYDDGLLYHPETLKKHFIPNLAKIVEYAHERKLKLIYHSHGDITSILSDLIGTGIDALLPLESKSYQLLKERLPEDFLLIQSINL
ncbi:hypothetical protein KKB18_12065 [bacterium]|nr:hypothetical protein [bacterium]